MQNYKCSMATLNEAFSAISSKIFPRENQIKLPKILEENVGNFCPSCGKTIFSNLLEINGKVYLEKNCCTKELVHLENDVEFFRKHSKCAEIKPFVIGAKNFRDFISKSPNHPIMPLNNLTKKCNMNCPICFLKFADFNQNTPELSIEAIKKIVEKYKSRVVPLTTAEPTMREDLPEIIKIIKDSGNVPGIVTNGLKLQDKNYLKQLKEAGMKFIMLQFDGFNREANIRFRGKDYLKEKLKVLQNIKETGGIQVMLGAVIEKDVNEEEIPKILHFATQNTFINRVNFMGLLAPTNKNTITKFSQTSYSDLVKIMEKYGYFDREYFLETVKMNRNIHEVARKLFKGTPLENWILTNLPDGFNSCLFKKKTSYPIPLLQKNKIRKINAILVKIINKNKKAGAWFALSKSFPELINSPLWRMALARFFPSFGLLPGAPGTLEVFLTVQKSPITNTLLRENRRISQWKSMTILFSAGTPIAGLTFFVA